MWNRLRDTLRPMLPCARWVKEILSGAGGAHRFEDIGVSRERLIWAVLNGAQYPRNASHHRPGLGDGSAAGRGQRDHRRVNLS